MQYIENNTWAGDLILVATSFWQKSRTRLPCFFFVRFPATLAAPQLLLHASDDLLPPFCLGEQTTAPPPPALLSRGVLEAAFTFVADFRSFQPLPSVPAPTKPSSGDLLQRTPPENRGSDEPTTSPPSSLLLVLVAANRRQPSVLGFQCAPATTTCYISLFPVSLLPSWFCLGV